METLDICMDSCGEGANLIHRVGHHLLGGAVTGACNGGVLPLVPCPCWPCAWRWTCFCACRQTWGNQGSRGTGVSWTGVNAALHVLAATVRAAGAV